MDKTQAELIRLRYAVKAWTLKAVAHFVEQTEGQRTRLSLPLPDLSPTGGKRESSLRSAGLLDRPDVQEYIQSVNRAIESKLESGSAATPRKVRLSMGVCGPRSSPQCKNPRIPARNLKILAVSGNEGQQVTHFSYNRLLLLTCTKVVVPSRDSSHLRSAVSIPDTEESERLVARMQEMVAQEKVLAEREAEDEAEIDDVERLINEKEAILSRLMDTVKGFSTIKTEYEKVAIFIAKFLYLIAYM